eukprot:768532-Hanusia_phi.AAC.2
MQDEKLEERKWREKERGGGENVIPVSASSEFRSSTCRSTPRARWRSTTIRTPVLSEPTNDFCSSQTSDALLLENSNRISLVRCSPPFFLLLTIHTYTASLSPPPLPTLLVAGSRQIGVRASSSLQLFPTLTGWWGGEKRAKATEEEEDRKAQYGRGGGGGE